jgi:hypothetical protein
MMQVSTRSGVGDFGILMRALSVASDVRKLGVTLVGFVVTVMLASILVGLGSGGAAGPPNTFRPGPNPVASGLTALLALLVWWVGSSLTIATVTRMCVSQLTGDQTGESVSWRKALDYVTGHLAGFLFGPLVFGVILLLLIVAEIVVLFVGRIPYLGELLIGIAFLPLLLINLFAAIAVVFGWFLLFPVVAVDGSGPVAASTRVLQFIRSDPIRIVLQLLIAFFVAFLVSIILASLVFTTFSVTLGLAALGLGPEKSAQLVAGVFPFVSQLAGPFGLAPAPFTISIAQFLITLASYIFLWGFLALPLVFVIASCCAVYLAGGVEPQALEPMAEPTPMPPLEPLEPVGAAVAVPPVVPTEPVSPPPAPTAEHAPSPAAHVAEPTPTAEPVQPGAHTTPTEPPQQPESTPESEPAASTNHAQSTEPVTPTDTASN